MRAYLPSTRAGLRELLDAGALPVTEVVRARSDAEEDEYDALQQAADRSQAMLEAPGRRYVVVVETGDPTRVPLRDVVAIHADVEDMDPEDDDPGELAWFGAQELGDLLA